MRRVASSSRSGDPVVVTVAVIRRRTAAASCSRPPPLQGLAAGASGLSTGSATGATEAVEEGGVLIEHRHHGVGAPAWYPEHHLVDPVGRVVGQLLVGGQGPERNDPDRLGG